MLRSVLILSATTLVMVACGSGQIPLSLDPDVEPAFDSWVELNRAGRQIDSGYQLTRTNGRTERAAAASKDTEKQPLPTSVQPKLVDLLATADDEVGVEVMIGVKTEHRLSRLPAFDRTASREDPVNLDIAAQREAIQDTDGALRAPERGAVRGYVQAHGGQVLEEFRLGNALSARMPVGAVRKMLAEREDIASVSLLWGDQAPAAYQIDDGRARITSNPYVAAGYDGTGYRVGLVDTGVRADHYTLTQPDTIALQMDCANTPYSNCNPYSYPYFYTPSDTRTGGGHGTAMANILVGNDNMGGAYEGVAPGALLDSANAYYGALHESYYLPGVLRSFDLLDGVDDVIVVNAINDDTPTSTVASAANDLYDQGVIVIAPVGNEANYDTYSPANAHKVLGVGAFYTSTGADYPHQSSGIDGTDDRFKPDLTGPTYFDAASNASSIAILSLVGTCPAAAHTGGAALLLRDYYDAQGWSTDPGAIYAALITFGDEGNGNLDDTDGAGNLDLGEVSSAVWRTGLTYLDAGEVTDSWFYVSPDACDLRAGVWWAEEPTEHVMIGLELFQSSTLRASSLYPNSVFQKVVYPNGMGVGWWRIRIDADEYNNRDNVKVHYLIHYRTNC